MSNHENEAIKEDIFDMWLEYLWLDERDRDWETIICP